MQMPKDDINHKSKAELSAENALLHEKLMLLEKTARRSLSLEFSFCVSCAGDESSLCFMEANTQMLEALQYSADELKTMARDFFTDILQKGDKEEFLKMLRYLSQQLHGHEYGGACKMKPKQGEDFWMIWRCRISEWYGARCPRLIMFSGIVVDDSMHINRLSREYQVGKARIRNKTKIALLNDRHFEIMPYINQGLTADKISEKVFTSQSAIEKRIQFMYRKLELAGYAALVIFIHENGYD
jgi:uncharacterized protein YeeX (DUF496 family)